MADVHATKTPDDTEDYFYLRSDQFSVEDLLAKAHDKWGKIALADLRLCAEHFHARHIGYDLYDGSDYDEYIRVERF